MCVCVKCQHVPLIVFSLLFALSAKQQLMRKHIFRHCHLKRGKNEGKTVVVAATVILFFVSFFS